MRFGGQIGAVGFEKKRTRRGLPDGFVEVPSVFKGGDAGERDQMAEFEKLPCLVGGARKTVKNAAQAPGIGLQGCQSIRPAVALMNDHIEFEPDGEIQLFLKKDGLTIFDFRIRQKEVFRARCGSSGGDRRAVEGWKAVAGQTVVIETAFAEGNDFGMLGECFEFATN